MPGAAQARPGSPRSPARSGTRRRADRPAGPARRGPRRRVLRPARGRGRAGEQSRRRTAAIAAARTCGRSDGEPAPQVSTTARAGGLTSTDPRAWLTSRSTRWTMTPADPRALEPRATVMCTGPAGCSSQVPERQGGRMAGDGARAVEGGGHPHAPVVGRRRQRETAGARRTSAPAATQSPDGAAAHRAEQLRAGDPAALAEQLGHVVRHAHSVVPGLPAVRARDRSVDRRRQGALMQHSVGQELTHRRTLSGCAGSPGELVAAAQGEGARRRSRRTGPRRRRWGRRSWPPCGRCGSRGSSSRAPSRPPAARCPG